MPTGGESCHSARTYMIDYFQYRVVSRSTGFRALFAFLALSVGLHICTPEFVWASDKPLTGIAAQSIGIPITVSNMVDTGGEDSECCVLAALQTNRGLILPVVVSVDPNYWPPVSPPTVVFTTRTPDVNKLFEVDAPPAFAIARVPVYLSTKRLRN